MKKLKPLLKSILSLIFWITVWWICALIVNRRILLPSPADVIGRFSQLLLDKEFYLSVAMSLIRILIGYSIGVILGIITAAAAFYSKAVETLLTPMFTAIRATPVASFIILALVWMGRGLVPSFTSALMVLPVVYGSVRQGLGAASVELAEVAEIYGFGFFKKLRLLYIPSALPSMINSSRTALGLAWKSGVAAEVLCSPQNSIGGEIYSSKLYLESVDLFAWTMTVILLSLILEFVLSLSTSGVYKKYTVGEMNNDTADNK